MRAGTAVALGGLVGAGLVLVLTVPRTIRRLEIRGAELERAAQTGQGRSAIAAQAAALREDLDRFANDYAGPLAERAATNHMRTAYGITEERIRRLDEIAYSLGVVR